MDVKISFNPAHSALRGTELQAVTEAQARQTHNYTAGAEGSSCSNSDDKNLSSRAEEQDVSNLESTIVSARAEQSSVDMVMQEDAASYPDEEKALLGKTPGRNIAGIKFGPDQTSDSRFT